MRLDLVQFPCAALYQFAEGKNLKPKTVKNLQNQGNTFFQKQLKTTPPKIAYGINSYV